MNLFDLEEQGLVTFSNIGSTDSHTLNSDGTISGGDFSDGSIGQVTFNFAITSVTVNGDSAPSSGNFDGVEIGYDDGVLNVVCFASGTMIATPTGPVAVETLEIGSVVSTSKAEDSAIRWIGTHSIDTKTLQVHGNLRPVRITAGALGEGLPHQDLLVSRQHRMLVSSKIAERMFGEKDVLISAIKLTALPGVYVDEDCTEVTYVHFLLDDHNVVFAEGAPSESLFTGDAALKALPAKSQEEIFALFPQLLEENVIQPAHPIPMNKKQKQLVERHMRNAVDMIAAE